MIGSAFEDLNEQLDDLEAYFPEVRKTAAERFLEDLAGGLSVETGYNVDWEANPGPQTMALLSEADELFYGGGAGGGKTDLLIGLSGTRHTRSIIFRREYTTLSAIIDRIKEVMLSAIGADREKPFPRFRLKDGRVIELGAVQHEGDELNFQGRPHDLKGFDEVCHFTLGQYLFLCGWNRTTKKGQRTRVVACGNPPTTPEGVWVIERWAPWLQKGHPNPAVPGELRWYASVDGVDTPVDGKTPFEHTDKKGRVETIYPRSRTFIPALLSDNPYLGVDYLGVLDQMPEPLRSQMKYGDFTAGIEDDPWQIIPSEWVEAAFERWKRSEGVEGRTLSQVGCDPARGGKDKTVLSRRYGRYFAKLEKHDGEATPDGQTVAGLVVSAVLGSSAHSVIDLTGVGTSVFDFLTVWGYDARDFVASGRNPEATDRTGKLFFANNRAEAYWRMREALDPISGADLCLPPDAQLKADLCTPRWSVRSGAILVESKEAIIDRIKRSPDCGDAVVLALFHKPKGASGKPKAGGKRLAVRAYKAK